MILACPLRNERTHMDPCFWESWISTKTMLRICVLLFLDGYSILKQIGFVSCCAKAKNWMNYSKVGTLISFCVIWSYYMCIYIYINIYVSRILVILCMQNVNIFLDFFEQKLSGALDGLNTLKLLKLWQQASASSKAAKNRCQEVRGLQVATVSSSSLGPSKP